MSTDDAKLFLSETSGFFPLFSFNRVVDLGNHTRARGRVISISRSNSRQLFLISVIAAWVPRHRQAPFTHIHVPQLSEVGIVSFSHVNQYIYVRNQLNNTHAEHFIEIYGFGTRVPQGWKTTLERSNLNESTWSLLFHAERCRLCSHCVPIGVPALQDLVCFAWKRDSSLGRPMAWSPTGAFKRSIPEVKC